jgi:hypothetical protein
MRIFVIVLTIAALTVPAFSQGSKGNRHAAPKTEEPKKKPDEKGYKAALDRMPDRKYDPWGTVRPGDDKK